MKDRFTDLLLSWKMFSTIIKLTKKCDGQGWDAVLVMSTIVDMLLGFEVGEDLRELVSRFTAVDECLATIRIKPKYFYISLLCAHAPTEDKDDKAKSAFYDKLEVLYNRCPIFDIKILVGDFNAKVGRAQQSGNTVCTGNKRLMASD